MSVATHTLSVRRSALARLTITEFRLFLREPMLVFWGFAFPLLLLIIFGLIPGFKQTHAGYQGLSVLDTYVPILIVLMLAMLSYFALPTVLAGYREQGILRRLQTTPAGALRVLAAQLLVNCASAIVMVALILVVGRVAFGVPFPLAPGIWVVIALLTTAGTLTLGLLVAAVAPTARVATTIGSILFYPLMFFSGLYVPIPSMPLVLQHISHATPLGAAWESLQDAALGHWPSALALLTIIAYPVVFGLAAARLFRWE
ncbi:MAG TPA: ABC transporter permease [Trebonia sp.]|jgi:ABC-2 type transport system permease protein|nr:ABC transporter permease [Trebonia sp.]